MSGVGCCWIWLYLSLVVAVQGLYKCPDGFTSALGKCYKEERRANFRDAIDICRDEKATLWRPETEAENALFVGSGNDSYYLNLEYSNGWWTIYSDIGHNLRTWERYDNFQSVVALAYSCGVFDSTGLWRYDSCTTLRKFRCERNADCVEGYFGSACALQCHCAGRLCDSVTGYCPDGCLAGWAGQACSQKMAKAEGMYYCLKTPEGGRDMILRVSLNHVTYRLITAIDKGGNPVMTCGRGSFEVRDGIATITVSSSGDSFKPDCGSESVSNDTSRWRFQFKQYPAIYTKHDVTFEVTCNFASADDLVQSSSVSNEHGRQALEHLVQSHIQTALKLVDSSNGRPVTNATVGHKVKLVVEFKKVNELGLETIAPYSCEATTLDGATRLALTDPRGCPLSDSPVFLSSKASKINNTVLYTSKEFEVFAFPGQEHVLFTCHIEICFSRYDTKCDNRCENAPRTERSVPDSNTQSVGTVLSVKP